MDVPKVSVSLHDVANKNEVIIMNFRLANVNDLEFLKEMYEKIIDNMYKNDIKIWNEFYPFEVIKEDVEGNNFYVLENDKEIIASCALCNSNSGENEMPWAENTKDVFYIDRLGVNADYLRQGIGSKLINEVKSFAKKEDKKYIRLFVVDSNLPAINLYVKNGFEKVDGIYEEVINEECTLIEYGFELKI